MENNTKKQVELENLVLQKIEEIFSAIDTAKHVYGVICALHSLAVRLFSVDSAAVAGDVDQSYRTKILQDASLSNDKRNEWWDAFYHGMGFQTMIRILLYDVASKWLGSFPVSAKKQVYDSYFVQGPSSEAIQVLVPALVRNEMTQGSDCMDIFCNVERILVLCLIENEGVRHMVYEFKLLSKNAENAYQMKGENLKIISSVTQLLASIPDKARPNASPKLSPHMFFHEVVGQLLVGVEDCLIKADTMTEEDLALPDGPFFVAGEIFARVSRRGSTDVLVAAMIPKVLKYVRDFSSRCASLDHNLSEKSLDSSLWSKILESIGDQYALERISEELLRQLARKNVNDVEAYWILWLLFHHSFRDQTATRVMFVEKFLLWKVFPLCCLRWIVQFAIFECPPYTCTHMQGQKINNILNIVQRLVSTWSKREFVQSTPVEQQAYITAAIGLCLEKISKEELETAKDVLHLILQGVSCRLESPIHLIRKMASSIALTFSKVIDPKNPLYLDDDCCDTIDWEFGVIPKPKKLRNKEKLASASKSENSSEFMTVNLDITANEIIHEVSDDMASETSDDSSLKPYDLSDDDSDLQKRFSQLTDLSSALRKSDDPDDVERALDVAEHLVRASPDELHHISGDLVRALIHVRCSDVTVEGKEESAEEKRQKALVALLVTCPFESLDTITQLLYSPNVDISQRVLILDVMTEAAQELSDTKFIHTKCQQNLVSDVSDSQAWYLPSSRGPQGAGPWKEVSETSNNSILSWSNRYERELPSRPGQVKKGKTRRWSVGINKISGVEVTKNKFPLYAAAFMLPVMQGFDKKRHGVDLLNRDFVVLGKLIYMLGVCMNCVAMHPEASALTPSLLDMLRSREIAHHAEAYVRRSVLFAACSILAALHPSYVASALIEGNQEISNGIEWIRTWSYHISETDNDAECTTMAMRCLQLHAEMALQTSRALETASNSRSKVNVLPSKLNDIILPSSHMNFQM